MLPFRSQEAVTYQPLTRRNKHTPRHDTGRVVQGTRMIKQIPNKRHTDSKRMQTHTHTHAHTHTHTHAHTHTHTHIHTHMHTHTHTHTQTHIHIHGYSSPWHGFQPKRRGFRRCFLLGATANRPEEGASARSLYALSFACERKCECKSHAHWPMKPLTYTLAHPHTQARQLTHKLIHSLTRSPTPSLSGPRKESCEECSQEIDARVAHAKD
jgi:hypothetical protein